MAAIIGNQYKSSARLWTEAILQALDRKAVAKSGKSRIEILSEYAEKLLDAAGTGDLGALQELGNRIEGRPTQRIEGDLGVELTLRFIRDDQEWQAIEQEVSPSLESKLERQPEVVQETMRLVLQGVPEEHQQKVYDHAIETALAASTRGEGERPDKDLAEKPEVQEAVQGYGANLDTETEEERAKFEDALAKVNEHNARVRARKA